MKAVFSFSLLVCAALGWAGFADLERDLERAASPQDVREALARHPQGDGDATWAAEAQAFLATEDPDPETVERIKRLVSARAVAERAAGGEQGGKAAELAKRLKSTPEYADAGPDQRSNWLQRVLERVSDALSGQPSPPRNRPAQDSGGGGGFEWLVTVAWVLLVTVAVAGVGALFYFLRTVSWGGKRLRKRKAMLADDEPVRHADEWLEEANRLEREGRYREAVRCLYLACLMRLDESRVASFVRGQTNWEHCHRIMASPSKPPGLEFVPPTQAFDRIWYGGQKSGAEEIAEFRRTYNELCEHLGLRQPA